MLVIITLRIKTPLRLVILFITTFGIVILKIKTVSMTTIRIMILSVTTHRLTTLETQLLGLNVIFKFYYPVPRMGDR